MCRDLVRGGRPLNSLVAPYWFECSNCNNTEHDCCAVLAARINATDVTCYADTAVKALRGRLPAGVDATEDFIFQMWSLGKHDMAGILAKMYPVTIGTLVQDRITHAPPELPLSIATLANLAAAGCRIPSALQCVTQSAVSAEDVQKMHRYNAWQRWLRTGEIDQHARGWQLRIMHALQRSTKLPVELCSKIVNMLATQKV